MDKYTVDLDQVLNDFEYSELTDQHDQAKSNRQNSTAPFVHNNFKNTNVKHSINNVFHSLNEYLNTDISPKCEIKPFIQEPSFSGENSKFIDDDAPQDNSVIVNNNTDTKNEVNNEEEKTEVEEETAANDVTESEPIEVESRDVNDDKSTEDETDQVALIETIDESIKQKTDLTSVNPEDDSKNNENSIETIEDNTNDLVDVRTSEELSTDKTEDVDDEGVIKVGFDDDIDLDESELHKYLDELEKEYESEVQMENHSEEEETDGCEKEEIKVDDKDTEEAKLEENSDNAVSVRPNNLPLPNQESAEDCKGVINLVGEPGSTPYNNVYINKELPQEKQRDNSDTECSTSASPTFSDISSETNSSCTPSTDTVNDENQNGGDVNENGNKENDVVVDEPKTEENIGENETASNPSGEAGGGSGEGDVASEDVPPLEEAVNENNNPTSSWLGKQAPLWIPDAEATSCLHCDMKFTVIKRRHHCRACGYVLCSKCCSLKFRLEYLEDVARVCNKCYEILSKEAGPGAASSSGSESSSPKFSQPNPNNPLEYCSTIPPHQQVSGGSTNPPSVMVPVGVLKRKGSNKARTNKSVMFCDGIRPGSDLTNLDNDFGYTEKNAKKTEDNAKIIEKSFPGLDPDTKSFIPKGDDLPPTVTINKTDMSYTECSNGPSVVEMLRNEALIFSLQTNLLVHLKIINMDCCINKLAWCFCTEGLISVGQDEIVILLELLDDENTNIIKPKEPYLIGILIHRWETPWAKLFPLRLILRLGAEYRYYPSPIISNRHRDSVFVEIGHTIINLLA
ncbi:DUF3480, FYVE, SARA and/or Mpp10 domain containing protein, partial [Asbolus verrucosus]